MQYLISLCQVELAYPISFSAWFIPKAMKMIGLRRGGICNEPRLGILLQLHRTTQNQDPWTPQDQPLQCLDDVKITSVNRQSGHLRKPRVGNPKPPPSQHLLLSFYLLDCLCAAIQVLQKRNCAKQLSAAAAMAFLPNPAARSQEHIVPSRHPQRSQRNEVLAWLPAGLPREYFLKRWKMKVPSHMMKDERKISSHDPGHASGKQGLSLWRPGGFCANKDALDFCVNYARSLGLIGRPFLGVFFLRSLFGQHSSPARSTLESCQLQSLRRLLADGMKIGTLFKYSWYAGSWPCLALASSTVFEITPQAWP